MELEPLDLTHHDPDEFEGKAITYNGCTYIVGRHIETGKDRIVHDLINAKSGLSLHVIKVVREPMSLEEFERYSDITEKVQKNNLTGSINSTVVRTNGGQYEIEQTFKGFHDSIILEMAELVLQRRSDSSPDDPNLTESWCKQALAKNPYHTEALRVTAIKANKQGKSEYAIELLSRAIAIEPNYLSYRTDMIRIAAGAGLIRFAISEYESMKEECSYWQSEDELAAQLYLLSGLPMKALNVIEQWTAQAGSHDMLSRKQELRQIAERDLVARAYSHSYVEDGWAKFIQGRADAALQSLKKAYELYDKDPYLRINLGLAYRREGDFERSVALLKSVYQYVPREFQQLCLANAAFAEVKAKRFSAAIELLEMALPIEEAPITKDGSSTDPRELPQVVHWIVTEEQQTMQIASEPINSALRIVEAAVEGYSKEGNIPPMILELVSMYRATQ